MQYSAVHTVTDLSDSKMAKLKFVCLESIEPESSAKASSRTTSLLKYRYRHWLSLRHLGAVLWAE